MRMRWLLLLIAVCCAQTRAADDSLRNPTIEDFIAPPFILSLSLSPDGSKLVALGYNGRRYGVLLADADEPRFQAILQTRPNAVPYAGERFSLVDVDWLADDLLAVNLSDDESRSIDLKGKTVAQLGVEYIGPIGRPNDAYSSLVYRDMYRDELARVNPRTGERQNYRIGLPGRLVHSAFDGSGNLRAVTMIDSEFWSERSTLSQWYRSNSEADWELLEKGPVVVNHWQPLFIRPDGSLVIRTRRGRDTWAIEAYDPRSRQTIELMAEHPTEDISFRDTTRVGNFRRVITQGLKPQTHWFDEQWAEVQRAVDTALPGRVNHLSGDPKSRVLVLSFSDLDPGTWYLVDLKQKTFREVARFQPRVLSASMRPMQTLRYAARDGLSIPAYFTTPRTEGPWPLVVMIHGGPAARDHWGWDPEVQLLALRGYAVLQPQFRGSSGFGANFENAGRGQWGLAMQDDITDGVRHLIDRKLVDPNRICILGASYGGYAALWGLEKTPELYRCGISFAGVTDIDLVLNGRSDINLARMSIGRELRRHQLGLLAGNGSDFSSVSAVKHANRIQAPVLLMHGEKDLRVPMAHGRRMAAALDALHKPYQWLQFDGEGHGLIDPANQRRYYLALLDFLDRHIGPLSPAVSKEADSTPP